MVTPGNVVNMQITPFVTIVAGGLAEKTTSFVDFIVAWRAHLQQPRAVGGQRKKKSIIDGSNRMEPFFLNICIFERIKLGDEGYEGII
ncbi:hypothetical protein DMENIID0001_018990 [Sergentomyia squamirostris]